VSATGAKTRIRVAGAELDAQIEREIAEMPKADVISNATESREVTAVSVDTRRGSSIAHRRNRDLWVGRSISSPVAPRGPTAPTR
jgi:hypothetical protein